MQERTKPPIVVVRNLSKTVVTSEGPLHILRNANVDIHDGELTGIHGKSGSGKSTFLNVAGLLDQPDPGSVLVVEGQKIDFNHTEELARWRRKIGFVFQSFNLISHLSAWHNVAIRLATQGQSWSDACRAAWKWLEYVGLTQRAAFKPHSLSGGEQQRVGIARALVGSPRLVLADEPTGNLDQHSARQIMQLLRQCAVAVGVPVVMVSHDEDLVSEYCDRVLRCENGTFVDDVVRRRGCSDGSKGRSHTEGVSTLRTL